MRACCLCVRMIHGRDRVLVSAADTKGLFIVYVYLQPVYNCRTQKCGIFGYGSLFCIFDSEEIDESIGSTTMFISYTFVFS